MMSNANHTPGPWEVINKPNFLFVQAKTPPGQPYEGVSSNVEILSEGDYPTKEGDAKLIAAAPELLKALQRMQRMHGLMMKQANHGASFYQSDCLQEMNEAPIQARQAIMKAGVTL